MSANLFPNQAYSPADKYLWDAWFTDDPDGRHRAFYLQAPNSFTPDQRHDQASIGHAVSADYANWQEIGTALNPGERGAWDDIALWTGSVIVSQETGNYHHFYTGRGSRDPFAQKVGRAVSTNLVEWRKTTLDRPLLEAVQPYSTYSGADRGFPAWRDPYLFRNNHNGQYEMLITARLGDEPYNGCVARATSPELDNWTVTAPLLAPGRYDEMEVPQLVNHDGDSYLFFSTWSKGYNPGWKDAIGGAWSGLHAFYARGSDFSRPFLPVNDNGVVAANGKEMYSIRLLDRLPNSNDYRAIGWLNENPGKSEFVGALSTPFTVTIDNGEVGVRMLNS
ncbi:MAG: glycoside hydrolase family 68 protein [Candidatus Saccharimonadales bacterium]